MLKYSCSICSIIESPSKFNNNKLTVRRAWGRTWVYVKVCLTLIISNYVMSNYSYIYKMIKKARVKSLEMNIEWMLNDRDDWWYILLNSQKDNIDSEKTADCKMLLADLVSCNVS